MTVGELVQKGNIETHDEYQIALAFVNDNLELSEADEGLEQTVLHCSAMLENWEESNYNFNLPTGDELRAFLIAQGLEFEEAD